MNIQNPSLIVTLSFLQPYKPETMRLHLLASSPTAKEGLHSPLAAIMSLPKSQDHRFYSIVSKSWNIDVGCFMLVSLFSVGLGLEDGHVLFFWLLLSEPSQGCRGPCFD